MTTTKSKAATVMPRAAIYVRISADHTGEGAGVARQEKQARLLARAKGWDVREVLSDNDRSASDGKVRPEYERLVREVEAGRFDAVIVWHIDRLVRKMSDLTRLIEVGQPRGLSIAAVQGVSLDLSDPTGVAVAQILTAIAGMEVAHKGARQSAANRQRAEKGKPGGGFRTYGYETDGSARESEAHYVRQIFERFVAGAPITHIAAWMGEEGQMGASGSRRGSREEGGVPMSRSGVRSILTNRRYIGEMAYRGETVSTEGAPLVDRETFEAAQSRLADPTRKTTTEPRRRWLGSGVYRCGVCGGKLVSLASVQRGAGGVRKSMRSYRCPGHVTRLGELIDAYVKAEVCDWLRSNPAIAAGLSNDRDSSSAKALRDELVALQTKEDTYALEHLDGHLTARQVGLLTAKLHERITELSGQLSQLGQRSRMAEVLGAADPGAAWLGLDIWGQVDVLNEVATVTVLKTHTGQKFSPASVQIDWRATASESMTA